MPSPLATIFSYLDTTKRKIANLDAEQLGDTLLSSIRDWNKKMDAGDPEAISQVLNVVTPVGLGTLVPAFSHLKGMPGIHPRYNPEAASAALSKEQINNLDLWEQFGVTIDKGGYMKTNVSDKGTKLNKISEVPGTRTRYFEAISHPNQATIESAVPGLSDKTVEFVNKGSLGQHSKSEGNIQINIPGLASTSAKEVEGLNLQDRITSAILHEGQHGIQYETGTAGGANTASVQGTDEFSKILSQVRQKFPTASPEDQAKQAAYATYRAFTGEQESSAVQKLFRDTILNPQVDQWETAPAQLMLPESLQIYK